MSAWEDEERRKAAEELRQMELEAEVQAEVERQQVRGKCPLQSACMRSDSLPEECPPAHATSLQLLCHTPCLHSVSQTELS